MKHFQKSLLLAGSVCAFALTLVACAPFGGTGSGTDSASSSSSESSVPQLVTHNVSYVGTIGALETSIYMQGTHQLNLDDGRLVLLQTTDGNLNLDVYLGKRVEVRGSVEPTVESGGLIMHVEEVTILELADSSSSESQQVACGGFAGLKCPDAAMDCIDNPNDECDPANGGADCIGMCVPAQSSSSVARASSSSSSKKSEPAKSSSSSKAAVSSSVATSSSSVPAVTNADMEAQIVMMAKQNYAADSLWTQRYCTSHIAFCIPVHKNWYFKSFGATTTNLWHVEFGMADIESINQGVMMLNLVSGSSAAAGGVSGQFKTQGSDVVGYRDWNDGTHFELIADARLKAAMSYMLDHVTTYTPGE
jgi:hypothetical protein